VTFTTKIVNITMKNDYFHKIYNVQKYNWL